MKITGYKGFNYNFQCQGFQFEVGKEYTINGELEMCENGFHFCRKPLNVFGFYGPTERFALIEATDQIIHEGIKSVCSKIKIIKELTLQELLREVSGKQITKRRRCLRTTNTGNYSVATNLGYRSVATNTGNYSVATNTGNYSVATNVGYRSVATNTGNYSVAMNVGDRSATANAGYYSMAMNTGYYSVATNTGSDSVATNAGESSVAIVEKPNSIAIVTGYRSKAKGIKGSWLVLTERDCDFKILHVKSVRVDGVRIKENIFYCLRNGRVQKVD